MKGGGEFELSGFKSQLCPLLAEWLGTRQWTSSLCLNIPSCKVGLIIACTLQGRCDHLCTSHMGMLSLCLAPGKAQYMAAIIIITLIWRSLVVVFELPNFILQIPHWKHRYSLVCKSSLLSLLEVICGPDGHVPCVNMAKWQAQRQPTWKHLKQSWTLSLGCQLPAPPRPWILGYLNTVVQAGPGEPRHPPPLQLKRQSHRDEH